MKYKITVKNPNYCGVTHGVAFANGVAYVEDELLKNILVNNYGYTAEPVEKEEAKPKPRQAKRKRPAN